jgi:DNA-binding MarR family transcriptional regulator
MAMPTYLAGHAARLGHEKHVELLSSHGLTLPMHAVLIALTDFGPLAPHKIAECLQMRRAHVSAYVETLIQRQLVTRQPDVQDRRSHRVALTPAGRELAGILSAEARDVQRTFLDGLSKREQQQLTELLTKVIEHADRTRAEE